MNNCLECGKETNNPKFCSCHCSVIYWNKKQPKRKCTTNICPNCGNKKYPQSRLCQKCNIDSIWKNAMESKIKDYFRDDSPSRSKYNDIRKWARKLMEFSGKKKECEICGFDIHVEVCHKIPIYSFPEDSLMKEVNSLDNLVYLCPNHHIMFDKGLIGFE